MTENTPATRFHRAVALASSLVEGSATTVHADDADALHDPLVAAALLDRGRRDPVFASKLAGRHGAWVELPTDEAMRDVDEDGLAAIYARRTTGVPATGAAEGEF